MSTLGQIAAKGAAITLSFQVIRFLIQLAGLVVLARLLSPGDFGLIAMVTAITGFGEVVRDFGLLSAAVQSKSLSKAQQSNLFWINSSIGLLLGTVCVIAAPLFGVLYSDPRLAMVAMALATTFFFNGLQTQFQAKLTRDLNFKALSVTDVIAQGVALAVAMMAAAIGLGYWALVCQLIVQSLSLLILRFWLAKWVPSRPRRTSDMSGLLTFGRNLLGTQSLVYFSSNIDSVLMGRLFGAAQLGLYSRAFQILMMPLNQLLAPLSAVALPILSKLNGNSPEYNRFLYKGQTLLSYPAVGIFAVTAASSPTLIPFVFGESWTVSYRFFEVLAIGGSCQAIGYIGYWVFLSKGLTASHFRYSLISRSLLVISICLGSIFGPIGIAYGYSVGILLAWPLSLLWLRRVGGIEANRLLLLGLRALGAGIMAACVGRLVLIFVDNLNSIFSIGVSAMATIGVFGLLLIIPVYRRDFAHFFHFTRTILYKKSSQSSLERASR